MPEVPHPAEDVVLPDGGHVVVRPLGPEDGPELVRGLEHLSERSARRRFLGAPPHLSDEQVRYLTDVDHHDHEALGARDPLTGEGIGVARFVRDPKLHDQAEIAVTVTDAWQGRGVGTALLARLAERAREEGIDRLTGLTLWENRPMIKLFATLGPLRRQPAGCGTVLLSVEL